MQNSNQAADFDDHEELFIDNFNDKIKDLQRKIDLQNSAIDDLGEKTDEVRDRVRAREEEQ